MIELRSLVMDYPGVRALDGVSLTLREGRILGLIGENGAGKSTLLKILSGVQMPTGGSILVDDQTVQLHSVREAERLGIAMIHQELNLVDTLSIADNIVLGSEAKKGPFLDRQSTESAARDVLSKVGLTVPVTTLVADLTLAQKQLVEIAKAIHRGARIVIMDEPSAVLAERETENLLKLVLELKAQGVGVIYVSHRLKEVLQVSDEITVLRDGKHVVDLDNTKRDLEPRTLALHMVGREIGDMYPPKHVCGEDVVLELQDFQVEGLSKKPLSLCVHRGEIVGIGGLVGSGRTEVAEAIAGLRRRKGTIRGGAVAYVSEDRKGSGLFLSLPATENVTLPSLKLFGRLFLDDSKRVRTTKEWIQKLGIRISGPATEVQTLSGGNQQKVSLAKSLEQQPDVLILDEPTRGVDVGARAEIYNVISELSKSGLGVLVISSEMTELIGMCSRVYVMREHEMVGEVPQTNLTEQAIMELAAGVMS